ncbi:MAG: trypsin-like peptidase domain-containing protein [Nonlabens sp.]
MKGFLKTLGAAILGGAIVLGTVELISDHDDQREPATTAAFFNELPVHDTAAQQVNTGTSYAMMNDAGIDFTEAAEKTVNSVVHVFNKTVTTGYRNRRDLYYGKKSQREAIGTGSGVIITPDGYIVTNNHVIDNATELRVTLNNRKEYKAELIGTEPGSDIALLKIETDEELPYVVFGDSDQTRLGEWVLAIGNPFNLTSTVTAGIISAKGRDLNEQDPVLQNFIQTDAAVNPGNSGGALVNTNGELIGINTAIASKTGSYVGYSFAVPSNNARKIIQDLMEYGSVQKGMLGIAGTPINGALANRDNLPVAEGILIGNIVPGSGADKAAARTGDIITYIDAIKVRSFADLSGYVGSKNPGDVVQIRVLRNGRELTLPVTITLNTTVTIPELDMQVRELNDAEKKLYKVSKGVKILRTVGELAAQQIDLSDYVITKINGEEVDNVDTLKSIMQDASRYRYQILEMKNSAGETERVRL